MRKSDALKAEIRTAYNNGLDIEFIELAELYGLDVNVVRKIAREEVNDIRASKVKDTKADAKPLLDTQGNIKTKEALAFLQSKSQLLIEKSIDDGNYHVALQAMNTLSKQVEITMKKFGEFDTKDKIGELFPDDFGEFLILNMKREGLIKDGESDKKTNIEQNEDIDEFFKEEDDSVDKGDTPTL